MTHAPQILTDNRKQQLALDTLMDYDNGISELLYGGGARGGKTWLGCVWAILMAISCPKCNGMIVRETYTDLMGTTYKTFGESSDWLRSQGFVFDYRYIGGSKNYIEFANGSIVYLRYAQYRRSDDNFDRFGSYDLTFLFVDEAQQISAKFINVIRARFSRLSQEWKVGGKKYQWQVKPKMLFCCNPAKNWIYTDFYRPARDGKLPKYKKFIKALVGDNPYVGQDYIDNLLKSDKVTIERLYHGNFEYDDDPTTLCDYDAICDMFTNEHVQPNGAKSFSADIAGKGHDKFVGFSWQGNVARIAFDIDYSPADVVVAEISKVLREDGIARSLAVVDADGIGSFVSSYLPNVKEFHGGAAPHDKRYNNIKSECAFILADLIQRRAIRIVGATYEQQEAIKAEIAVLKQENIDNDTSKKSIISKEKQKELLGHSPDYLDALTMAMIFRVYNDKAQTTLRYDKRPLESRY